MNKRMVLRVLTGVLLTVVTAAGLQAQRGQRPPGTAGPDTGQTDDGKIGGSAFIDRRSEKADSGIIYRPL